MRVYFRVLIIFICLSSCGGGGGSSTSVLPSSLVSSSLVSTSSASSQSSVLKNQTFTFSDVAPLNVLVTETSKQLHINGTRSSGVATYKSSNPAVATIDTEGLLTVLKEGTTIVSLTVAATSEYTERTVTLTVNIAPHKYEMTTLVGVNDAKVLFSPFFNGLEFYRATERICDFKNISSCANASFDILNGNTVVDKTFTLSRPAYYTLKHGEHSNYYEGADQTFFATEHFSPRSYHQTTYFNNKYWLIGGEEWNWSGGERDSSIWSSYDGVNWERVVKNPPFGFRSRHQIIIFNKKMWLIGGNKLNDTKEIKSSNDIWSSVDGVNWVEVKAKAEFPPVVKHQIVSFNNKLWLYAANDIDSNTFGDIWSSSDAIAWQKESTKDSVINNYFRDFRVVSFSNKLWIIGSYNLSSTSVASSLDGKKWTFQSKIGDEPSIDPTVFVLNNQIHLLGYGYDAKEEWATKDGVNWELSSDFIKVFGNSQVLTRDNTRATLIGGPSGNEVFFGMHSDYDERGEPLINPNRIKNMLWSPSFYSDQRIINEQMLTQNKFGVIENHSVTLFNNKFWLIGGRSGVKDNVTSLTPYSQVTWSSGDGLTWKKESLSLSHALSWPFGFKREGHKTIVFNGKLWLIGGSERPCHGNNWLPDLSPRLNDVWNTADGLNWVKVTGSPNFSPRMNHQLAVFKGELWLFGGNDCSAPNGQQMGDAWSTVDGVTWTKQFDVSQMPKAAGTVKQAGNDIKMYSFINGVNREELFWIGTFFEKNTTTQVITPKTEAWTYDGSSIVRGTFSFDADVKDASYERKIAVNGNKLLMLNGYGNEILESQDGLNWVKVGNAPFVKTGTDIVVLNGSYFVIGGRDKDGPKNDVWVSQDGREWRRASHYRITLH